MLLVLFRFACFLTFFNVFFISTFPFFHGICFINAIFIFVLIRIKTLLYNYLFLQHKKLYSLNMFILMLNEHSFISMLVFFSVKLIVCVCVCVCVCVQPQGFQRFSYVVFSFFFCFYSNLLLYFIFYYRFCQYFLVHFSNMFCLVY